MSPEGRGVAAEAMDDVVRSQSDLFFDCVMGPQQGDADLAARLAERLGLPCVYLWCRPGSDAWVQGEVKGCRALFVDDVSYDGEISCGRIEAARSLGWVIEHHAVLVDRSDGDAAQALGAIGVQLLPVLRLDDEELDDPLG